MRLVATVVASIVLVNQCAVVNALAPQFGAQAVNLQRLLQKGPSSRVLATQASTPFPQLTFTQPLDHFSDTGHTFQQRYWLSTRHYNPNSATPVPVIVLDGGEETAEDRLPYLDTGIIDILTEATGGIGVLLEHRYYGDSVPVQNFTTDSLRYVFSVLLCPWLQLMQWGVQMVE